MHARTMPEAGINVDQFLPSCTVAPDTSIPGPMQKMYASLARLLKV